MNRRAAGLRAGSDEEDVAARACGVLPVHLEGDRVGARLQEQVLENDAAEGRFFGVAVESAQGRRGGPAGRGLQDPEASGRRRPEKVEIDRVEIADGDLELEFDPRPGRGPVGPEHGIAVSGRAVIGRERGRQARRSQAQSGGAVDESARRARLFRRPVRPHEILGRLEGERQPFGDGRKRRVVPVRLGLVPVGDRGEEVGAVVGVAVLDRDLDALLERHGVRDVETVDRGLGPGLEVLFLEGAAVEEGLALAHPPGVGEIILGAGAVQGRLGFAVHLDPVIALAPPAQGALEDAQGASDVVPGAFGLQEQVVALRVGRELLSVLGMEGGRVGGKIRELAVVDVIIEGVDGPRPLVRGRDPARAAEGHIPVAVAGPALRGTGDREGGEVPVQSVADAEKIADGRFDRGGLLAVPIDAQDDLAAVERLGGDGRPDMMDGRGPLDLGQDRGPARLDDEGVAVAAAPVVGRDAAAAVVLPPAEALQQVLAGQARRGQDDGDQDEGTMAHGRDLLRRSPRGS